MTEHSDEALVWHQRTPGPLLLGALIPLALGGGLLAATLRQRIHDPIVLGVLVVPILLGLGVGALGSWSHTVTLYRDGSGEITRHALARTRREVFGHAQPVGLQVREAAHEDNALPQIHIVYAGGQTVALPLRARGPQGFAPELAKIADFLGLPDPARRGGAGRRG